MTTRVGIDLMGSGTSPKLLLEGILAAIHTTPFKGSLVFFATPDVFSSLTPPQNCTFVSVQDVIEMEDAPLTAIRQKKNSSIHVATAQLNDGVLDALISAGNTGALLACAKLTLPMIPGISRPALLTLLPTRQEKLAVLDVGANATYKPQHLIDFALMGAAYQKYRGIPKPRIGLLNIGVEAQKGTPELKKAYEELKSLESKGYTFVGNIEAREALQGTIDVLVTDGFTGNVFLKTAEGVASVLLEKIQEEFQGISASVLEPLKKRLQYTEYPGALLIGINRLLIKCHGNPTPSNFLHSICHAESLHTSHFLDSLKT